MTTAPAVTEQPALDASIGELASLLASMGRRDLGSRAQAAAARLRRPNTVVCMVGEFKQGKSSLVNALLGVPACSVDDDLATSAITLVRYGEQLAAAVKQRDASDRQTVTPIAFADVHEWACEAGNPANRKAVERVEITVPSSLLKPGLVLVDTPGVGGLNAGQVAATNAFLPFADGLLFVSDASSELSRPELEFLERAVQACPTVMFVLTKIDLYPRWQHIAELNRAHLERAGLRIPMVAVSSVLRDLALRRKDRTLNDRSRVPEVIQHLSADVVGPARATAADRSSGEALAIIDQVVSGLQAELDAALDPESAKATLADLESAKQRLEYLRGPAAKWSTVLGDRTNDLSNNATFRFRSVGRQISRMMDERIDVLTRGDEWDELATYLQTVVAEEVGNVFRDIEAGRVELRAEIVEMLRDEQIEIGDEPGSTYIPAVDGLWSGKGIDEVRATRKKAVSVGLTTIRGAQGGITMFGMLGNLLPAAATALLASNPVLLGVGALFGSMGLAEDRKRKVTQRRQSAKAQVRQFLDDVQFEVNNEIAALIRGHQRELRDEFSARLAELVMTCTQAAQSAQATAQASQSERQARASALGTQMKVLADLATRIRLAGGRSA